MGGDPLAGQLAVAGRERLEDPAVILGSSPSSAARLAAEASGGITPPCRWMTRTIVRPTSLPDAFMTIAWKPWS